MQNDSAIISGTEFKAPWGIPLIIVTTIGVLILAGIPALILSFAPHDYIGWIISTMFILPLVIFLFFIIRGYRLTADTLLIQRLGWNTKIDLKGLQSAQADPEAMAKSVRPFGNGGLFCFAGLYSNRKLGSYRAFVTDFKKSVILKFTHRTIVVTPDEPERFVTEIKKFIP
jgi:hypothetical protein